MTEQTLQAETNLQRALESEKLIVWPVNKRSDAFALGLFWGVSLSWPGDKQKIEQEMETVKRITERVSQESRLRANFDGPTFAAGGALAVYCGFKTPYLALAEQKAKEQNKPIWQVCEEDAELKELAK